jgi:hypothetical protein
MPDALHIEVLTLETDLQKAKYPSGCEVGTISSYALVSENESDVHQVLSRFDLLRNKLTFKSIQISSNQLLQDRLETNCCAAALASVIIVYLNKQVFCLIPHVQ